MGYLRAVQQSCKGLNKSNVRKEDKMQYSSEMDQNCDWVKTELLVFPNVYSILGKYMI